MLSSETRAAILEDLQSVESQSEIARKHGVGVATVNRLVKEMERNGIKRNVPKRLRPPGSTAAATEAAADYAYDRRVRLLNKMFVRIEERIDDPTPIDSDDIRKLALSVAILIDKRRLEDGEATGREEVSIDDRSAIAEFEGRITRLVDRRRTG